MDEDRERDRDRDDDDGHGIGRKVSLLEVGYRDVSRHIDKVEAQLIGSFEKLNVASEAGRARLAAEIEKLQQNINDGRQLNWPFIVTLLGFGFVLFSGVISGFYFLSSQNTSNLLQPFALRVEVLNQAMGGATARLDKMDTILGDMGKQLQANVGDDQQSKQDRADQRHDIEVVRSLAGENAAALRTLRSWAEADSGEKEVQIDTIEQRVELERAYFAKDLAELCREVKGRACEKASGVRIGIANRKSAPAP